MTNNRNVPCDAVLVKAGEKFVPLQSGSFGKGPVTGMALKSPNDESRFFQDQAPGFRR